MNSRSRSILVITSLAAFLTPFVASAVNVAMPRLAAEFSLDAITLSWVASSFMLSAAVCLLPFGRLADGRGRRPFFLGGLLLFGVSSLAAAAAPTTAALMAARVLQGAGGAMLFATAIPVLLAAFPAERRGRVLGVNVAAVYLGITLGPVLGGMLMRVSGWRAIFAASGGLALLLAAPARTVVGRDDPAPRAAPLDWPGTLAYAAALVSLMTGLSRVPALSGWLLLAVSLAAFALFFRRQAVAVVPLLDVREMRGNLSFSCSNVAALLHYSATSAVAFLVSLHLQYLRGFTASRAGLVLMSQPALMALLSPACGLLAERVQPRVLASVGMAMTGVALAAFVWVGAATPLAVLVGLLLLLGAGFALFSSPNTQAVMGAVTPRQHGVASALLGTMRLLGQMASMALVTLVLALRHGPQPIAPDTFPALQASTRVAFALFAALCFVGVRFSLARGRIDIPGAGSGR